LVRLTTYPSPPTNLGPKRFKIRAEIAHSELEAAKLASNLTLTTREESNNIWDCGYKWIWDEKNYAPINYDGKTPPVEFMNKALPLSIKGEQDT